MNVNRRQFLATTAVGAVVPVLGAQPARARPAMFGAAAGSDPSGAVIVATAPAGRKAFFADMVRTLDGRLVVAYRDSVAHINQDGRILIVHSDDDGRTWSAPVVAVDTDIDDRDPKIAQLSDGTLVMNFFRTDWTGYPPGPVALVGTFVTRSTDGGHTWSEPVQVGTKMSGATDVIVGIYRAGHAATHGPIIEVPNGDLLVPIYGRLPDGGDGAASVVRSTDRGLTWPAENESFFPGPVGFDYQEPNVSLLRDGTIMAILRSSRNVAYLSYSRDNGHTWRVPIDTGLPASSHHQLVTLSGDVLLTYGDLSRRFGPGRPTVGRLLQHPERGVAGPRDVLLYDAAVNGAPTADQANPSSVELSPGRFFTTTSDPYLASIVGVHSRLESYLR